MSRSDGIKDILRLALIMQDSYQGLSIQDIQDEFVVSRSTAIRMKRIIEEVFAVEEVENLYSPVKKWRLCKKPLTKMVKFTTEEIAELENCKSMMKNLHYTNRCDFKRRSYKKAFISARFDEPGFKRTRTRIQS